MTAWPTILQAVQAVFLPILTALGVGLAALAAIQMGRWKKAQERKDYLADLERAKKDLVTMKDNSDTAVKAVEQLYPDAPPAEKAKLAMTWASHLNAAAHISTGSLVQPNTTPGIAGTQATQTITNEAHVLGLASEPKGEG